MNLTFLNFDGWLCPHFVCEHCCQPIVGQHGLVTWKDYERPVIVALHKGPCERAYTTAHGKGPWREIEEFLTQLLNNTVTLPIGREVTRWN